MPSHDLALGANFTSNVLLLNAELFMLTLLTFLCSWGRLLFAARLPARLWAGQMGLGLYSGFEAHALRIPVILGADKYVCSRKKSSVTWCSFCISELHAPKDMEPETKVKYCLFWPAQTLPSYLSQLCAAPVLYAALPPVILKSGRGSLVASQNYIKWLIKHC